MLGFGASPGERDTLLLAARHFEGEPLAEAGKAMSFSIPRRGCAAVADRHAGDLEAEGDVVSTFMLGNSA